MDGYGLQESRRISGGSKELLHRQNDEKVDGKIKELVGFETDESFETIAV